MDDNNSDSSGEDSYLYERKRIKTTNWRMRHKALSTLESKFIKTTENLITQSLRFVQMIIIFYFTVLRIPVSNDNQFFCKEQLLGQTLRMISFYGIILPPNSTI